MKETKKENSTNQFALGHEGLGNTMYTLYTVKKKEKRNDLELYQKFVYHVAQTFLQDFNLADQQFFNIWLSTHPRNFGSDKIVYIYVRTCLKLG